jgi:hypothetical protein
MDANILAKSIVDQAVGERPLKKVNPKRSEAAKLRAIRLGPEKTSAIAAKGAAARWQGKEKAEG